MESSWLRWSKATIRGSLSDIDSLENQNSLIHPAGSVADLSVKFERNLFRGPLQSRQ